MLADALPGWQAAGLPVETLRLELTPAHAGPAAAPPLPSLLEQYRRANRLPARLRLSTLFVDLVGSTQLLARHPPETVLGFVQCFMRLVTEVALAYGGDVKDYEGDGALLYFESTAEAAAAALAIRDALAGGAECQDAACPVAARLSLTVGDVVLGLVGAGPRQAVAIVGPSVNTGARLLKRGDPGDIVVTGDVVRALAAEASELSARCRPLDGGPEAAGGDVTAAAWTLD